MDKKTAVVTGTSSGIGQAVAERLIAEGFRVIGISRSCPTSAHLRDDYLHFRIDLAEDGRDHRRIEMLSRQIVTDLGLARIDALVNCAGVVTALPLAAMPTDALDRMMKINLMAPIALTRALFPELTAAKGRILNIGSLSSRVMMPLLGGYGLSKRALQCFTEVIRLEGKPFGIKACYVELGNVRTGIHSRTVAESARLAAAVSEQMIAPYRESIAFASRSASEMESRSMETDAAARAIVGILLRKRFPAHATLGRDARRRRLLASLLPSGIRERMIVKAFRLREA
jgi:short-subunit dehydrogenase